MPLKDAFCSVFIRFYRFLIFEKLFSYLRNSFNVLLQLILILFYVIVVEFNLYSLLLLLEQYWFQWKYKPFDMISRLISIISFCWNISVWKEIIWINWVDSGLSLIAWSVVCFVELLLSNNRFTFMSYDFSMKIEAGIWLTNKIGDLLRFDSSWISNVLKKIGDWVRLILLILEKQFFLNQWLITFTIYGKYIIRTSSKSTCEKIFIFKLTQSLIILCYQRYNRNTVICFSRYIFQTSVMFKISSCRGLYIFMSIFDSQGRIY